MGGPDAAGRRIPDGVAPRGALAGAVAWLVGLGTFAAGLLAVPSASELDLAAFGFYNVQFVPLQRVSGPTTASGNALAVMTDGLGLFLAVVPAFVLVVAGGLLARRRSSDRAAAGAGASLAWGYLPLSVLGALVFVGPFFGGVYRPDPLVATVSGVAFPVAFGALGGVLGRRVGRVVARYRPDRVRQPSSR